MSNFLTIRKDALFTTERNARLRSTWIKFKGSAIVLHGLFRLIRTKIRWFLLPWQLYTCTLVVDVVVIISDSL